MSENSKSTTGREKGNLLNMEKKQSIHELDCEESGGTIHEKYYENGQLEFREYCKKGQHHRDGDQPAIEHYYESDQATTQRMVQGRSKPS